MAAAFGVGVRQLVDQRDLRPPRDDGVEVHFVEPLSFIFEVPARNGLQTFQQRLRSPGGRESRRATTISYPSFLRARACSASHSLADARRGTDKDSELADAAFFAARRREQGFRRGPMFGVSPLIPITDQIFRRSRSAP